MCLEAKSLADIAVPDLAGWEGAQLAFAGCQPPAEIGPPAAVRRGPAEDLGRVPQALEEDLGGGLDVVHTWSVPPRTLSDQNEMLALWITPGYRACGSREHLRCRT